MQGLKSINEVQEGDNMNLFETNPQFQPGDIVYVFYRNPHTQNVANIQEAAVVRHPDEPNQLAIFLYETYYPLSEEMAVFKSEAEACAAYQYYFGDTDQQYF